MKQLSKDYIEICVRVAAIVTLRYGKYTELADYIGVSRQSVSHWLSCLDNCPRVNSQDQIREWIKERESKIKRFSGIDRLKEVQNEERAKILKKIKNDNRQN